jgi:hypothetical protein
VTNITADKILGWLIPWFAGLFLTIVGWMAKSLYEISQNLSVVVYQIKDHTERITSLEDWRKQSPRFKGDQ